MVSSISLSKRVQKQLKSIMNGWSIDRPCEDDGVVVVVVKVLTADLTPVP